MNSASSGPLSSRVRAGRPSSRSEGPDEPGASGAGGSGLPYLLDERSRPDFRSVFGTLVRNSSAVDAAVARMRISGLDLRADEVRSVARIRLVLAEVNGIALRDEAEGVLGRPDRAVDLVHLLGLLDAGRIEVRSAPLAGWAPDFSVFRRKGAPWRCLVGPHWFARPYPHRGPALGSVHGPEAAGRLGRRFEELWRQAHDIGPALVGLLERARDRAPGGIGKVPVAQGKAKATGDERRP